MDLSLFDYELPQRLIAQEPLLERDKSKMMVLNRKTGEIKHDYFYNIVNYLNPHDIIVLNNSKVIKCRLFGIKEDTGARIECFVLEKRTSSKAIALLRPFKKIKENSKIIINKSPIIFFDVIKKIGNGKAIVEFNDNIEKIFDKYGEMPLPPYIKNRNFDTSYYQTIYAEKDGSVAAPTAGLHFTDRLLTELKNKKINIAKARLDISLDTFKPIKEREIENHKIHTEKYYLSQYNANKIKNAKLNGGNVIAIGTTTIRVLETIMTKFGELKGSKGKTNLYIYPGYKFKIVDSIVTNFHLPKSSLIVMISAFAGRETILNAYKEAIKENYKFYSFGDCMLII